MEQAINAYYKITASSEFRERERLREKARYDEAQALHHAKQEGRAEGRAEGLTAAIRSLMDSLGLPIEQAMTALNIPEIDRPKYKELLQKQ